MRGKNPALSGARGGKSTNRAQDNSGWVMSTVAQEFGFQVFKLQQDVWFELNFSSRMCNFSTEVLGIVRGKKRNTVRFSFVRY